MRCWIRTAIDLADDVCSCRLPCSRSALVVVGVLADRGCCCPGAGGGAAARRSGCGIGACPPAPGRPVRAGGGCTGRPPGGAAGAPRAGGHEPRLGHEAGDYLCGARPAGPCLHLEYARVCGWHGAGRQPQGQRLYPGAGRSHAGDGALVAAAAPPAGPGYPRHRGRHRAGPQRV